MATPKNGERAERTPRPERARSAAERKADEILARELTDRIRVKLLAEEVPDEVEWDRVICIAALDQLASKSETVRAAALRILAARNPTVAGKKAGKGGARASGGSKSAAEARLELEGLGKRNGAPPLGEEGAP